MSENINEIAGVEPSFKIDELKFNEKGLIPAIVQDPFAARIRRWRSTRFLPSSSQIRIVARYQSVPPFLFRHCTAVCSAYSDLPLPLPPVTIYNIVHLSSFSPNCSSFHALKTYAKNVLIRISHHTSGLYSSISISANVSISR